jgi:uncharacterized protein YggE
MKKRFAFVALQSIAIVAIAAVIAFSPAIAARQSVKADTTITTPTPSVSVTGTGKITVKPTIARINFGVFTSKETSSAAQIENDTIMAKITAALKAAGIKDEDIQTTGYSLQPRYEWNKETEKSVLVGYDMNHTMMVVVHAIKDATLEQTRLAALDLAMTSARKRADVVAKAAGKTILSVQTVNVNENTYSPNAIYRSDMGIAKESAPAPVEAGTMDILISVSVIYLF